MNNQIIDGFDLDSPDEGSRRLTFGWLLLALGSLVVAGLLTILIVMSRTPGIQEIFPWIDFFHTALVVHVDLTVLVWFLSCAGIFWTLNSNGGCSSCGWGALWLAVIGTAIISLSPFLGAGDPLMNNYVPVLQDPIFFIGLGVFGLGFTLLVLRGLFYSKQMGRAVSGVGALRFGLLTGLVISLVSVAAVVASYLGIPEIIEGQHYYELLFWGGGHTIQFTHIQLMLVAWLWLATTSGMRVSLSPRIAVLLFALGAIPALMTIYVYVAFDIGSGEHMLWLTWLMQYGGGIAALPVALALTPAFFGSRTTADDQLRAQRSALLFSILLFGMGGIIGFMISGSNVTIPAHYHGSIVAVTLAFMGVIYHVLPRIGCRKPTGRMARYQPSIYAVGQMMHIFGLAWSGGHGVQRKTAGSAQGLESVEKIVSMGMMGLGGLIAIIGGILFLVVVFRAIWPVKVAQPKAG